MGATIVDGLDTLIIMGLESEAADGIAWIEDNLNFNQAAKVSVFEVNIRFLGGLLSAYALTGRFRRYSQSSDSAPYRETGTETLKEKAYDIGKRLLPAFDTKTGIPLAEVNLQTYRYDTDVTIDSPCSVAPLRTGAGHRAAAPSCLSSVQCSLNSTTCPTSPTTRPSVKR